MARQRERTREQLERTLSQMTDEERAAAARAVREAAAQTSEEWEQGVQAFIRAARRLRGRRERDDDE